MKTRIDKLLVSRHLAPSREKARAMILAGQVIVDDKRVDKPGTLVETEDAIRVRDGGNPYVSRGGLKLAKALQTFQPELHGKVTLDVGASTGGFTDCLLRGGVKKVYALDVGYGQLAWSLRQDPRVVAIERTNIRHVTPAILPEPFDLVTIDVAFISLTYVLPVVTPLLKDHGEIIALIKPQFEVGKGEVGKNGVVRDPAKHEAVVEKIRSFAEGIGLVPSGVIESPILGPKGNREFVIYLKG
ncbi:MAG: TlyA family RNA methyltransferase [Deltaproteobacteria bacterium]|nr:TlyA family RNA methyltransferase [Deltaproteobacteria bacterium]